MGHANLLSFLVLSTPVLSFLHSPLLERTRPINSQTIFHAGAKVSNTRQSAVSVRMQQRRGPPVRPEPKVLHLINEKILFDEVRVVLDVPGASDELVGIMSRDEALAQASERELDLVCIAEKADPPVCKLINYGKFLFAREKAQKEANKANKGKGLKEVKMSYKIGQHDYDVRLKQSTRFLTQGAKVKFAIQFRGREMQHTALGEKLMQKMADDLQKVGVVETKPKLMGRQIIMIMNPKKTT